MSIFVKGWMIKENYCNIKVANKRGRMYEEYSSTKLTRIRRNVIINANTMIAKHTYT